MDPQLKAQLKQICAYSISSGTANAFGEVQVGSTATAKCRLESRVRSTERADGTFEVTRNPMLILAEDATTPTFEARFWLPGTSSSTAAFARKPKFIEPCIGERGELDHWELEF